MRARFDAPLDALGSLLLAFVIAYLVTSLGSAALCRRLPPPRLIAMSCLVIALALLLGSVSGRWNWLVLSFIVAGLGSGMFDATLNAYSALRAGPRAVNLINAGYGVGAVIGPVALGTAMNAGGSWRHLYMAVGAVLMTTAVLFGISSARGSRIRTQEAPVRRGSPTPLLQSRLLWTSLAVFVLYAGLEFAIGVWTFTLFIEGRGYETLPASASVSGFWAGLIVTRLLLAMTRATVPLAPLVRAALIVLTMSTALLAAGLSLTTDMIAVALAGLAAGPIFPSLMNSTAERLGTVHAPRAIALQTAAATIGQAAVPSLVGVVGSAFGLSWIALGLVVCSACTLLLHEQLIASTDASVDPSTLFSDSGSAVP